jgi:pyridoxal phosphate enzyme (YggS family)
MRSIHDNLQAVRERIAQAAAAAGRAPGSVALVAVSKTQPAPALAEARAAGQRAFGENYVQEAVEKMDALRDRSIEWHLVGPLQSNKTRVVAARFDWVHSVETEKVARRLSEARLDSQPPLDVLIQVNVSGEASKSGVAPGAVPALAAAVAALPRLRLRGLMAIPEPGAGVERYRALKALFDQLAPLGVDTLSVGMSDDMDLAIAEGSTMVRVGTAIFGARTPKAEAGACAWGPRSAAKAGA